MVVKRKKPDYIPMRIEQLKEDRDKAKQEYDKMWYTRLIQELDWCQQALGSSIKRNCYLQQNQ